MNKKCPDHLISGRNAIVTYVLNTCNSKLPIKYADLGELVGKAQLAECWKYACAALLDVYGIVAKEIPEAKSGKKFICYSTVLASSPQEFDKEQQMELTLLFLVLSFIFMSGHSMPEKAIELFLSGLRIYFDGTEHPYFSGNIKKLITDTFVKQEYLKRSKSDMELSTELGYLYSWGFRAEMEFDKERVMEAAATIIGKPVNFFIQRHTKAIGIKKLKKK